jgi:hypothetical protein
MSENSSLKFPGTPCIGFLNTPDIHKEDYEVDKYLMTERHHRLTGQEHTSLGDDRTYTVQYTIHTKQCLLFLNHRKYRDLVTGTS